MSNMEGSVAGDIESKIDAESKVDLESKIDTQSKVDAADQKAGEEANQDNPDNAPDQPKPEPGQESAFVDDTNPVENAEGSALIDMDQPEGQEQ